jgi:peptidoglycan/xylan/chitin deacetylase (PgdA/CDA1 family)
LLDILKKYNVSATFFVTGNGDDAMIAREYKEGHAIGLHTLSHNYSYIYRSVDNFFDDLYAVQDRVKAITGTTSMLMRFPGGSSNTVSRRYDGGKHIMSILTWEVENRGFTYFDWDILSGDAGETTDTGEVIERVTSAIHPGENVVLQHDIKDFSVAAVEEIIKFGKANGYKFEKLTNKSFTAHHGVNN